MNFNSFVLKDFKKRNRNKCLQCNRGVFPFRVLHFSDLQSSSIQEDTFIVFETCTYGMTVFMELKQIRAYLGCYRFTG